MARVVSKCVANVIAKIVDHSEVNFIAYVASNVMTKVVAKCIPKVMGNSNSFIA